MHPLPFCGAVRIWRRTFGRARMRSADTTNSAQQGVKMISGSGPVAARMQLSNAGAWQGQYDQSPLNWHPASSSLLAWL